MTTQYDDGVHYAEKLWPSWWLWTAAVIIGASVSLIFFPIDLFFGFLTMGAGILLLVFALVITTPTIEVREGWLRVGRAQIETGHLGRIVAHRGQAAREQLGPGFDARSTSASAAGSVRWSPLRSPMSRTPLPIGCSPRATRRRC